MVNKSEEKPTKMWKIEGEAFEKVKAASDDASAAADELRRVITDKKKALWDAIRDALPEGVELDNLSLDTDCESLGFYVVKENCDHGKGILGAIITAAKAS